VIVARSYERFNAKGFGADAGDRQGHGTAAAMLAAGVVHESPRGVVSGAAPKALLGNYKVLGDNGGGSLSGLLKAIDDAVNDGMDVLNLSLGDPRAPRASDDPVVRALENAIDRGVIVVTAAGNFGPQAGSVSSPGTTPRAITVGAIRSADGLVANYSGRGPVAGVGVKPEIVAPGDGLYCADSSLRAGSTGYRSLAGTSLAAPIVAGAAAVLKAVRPGLTPAGYKSLLVATAAKAVQAPEEGAGNGQLDLGAALASTIAPSAVNVLNAFQSDYCVAQPSEGLTVSPSEFAVADSVSFEVGGSASGSIALRCDSGTTLRIPVWP
jgi:subtilisin family serine protease